MRCDQTIGIFYLWKNRKLIFHCNEKPEKGLRNYFLLKLGMPEHIGTLWICPDNLVDTLALYKTKEGRLCSPIRFVPVPVLYTRAVARSENLGGGLIVLWWA